MTRLLTVFMCSLIGLSCSPSEGLPPGADVPDWIQLFDGETLDGWTPKIKGYEFGVNHAETFRVEEGAITVSYDGYDQFDEKFGHLFYEKAFSHYIIVVEYRFIGDQIEGGPGWAFRNSGIMIHSPPGESMLKEQNFPISIEVQLLGGNGIDERTTSNLCTPGTHVEMDGELVTRHCVSSTSKTYGGDQWVRAEVLVLGDSLISHRLEEAVVLEYQKPQIGGGSVDPFDPAFKIDGKLLDSGFISLQSESHPVQFRKVELLNLKGCMNPKASNFKSYLMASDPRTCNL